MKMIKQEPPPATPDKRPTLGFSEREIVAITSTMVTTFVLLMLLLSGVIV